MLATTMCMAGVAKLAPGAAEVVNASLPLGHAQATWDIAIAAVFLASNGARCISGDTLVSSYAHHFSGAARRCNAAEWLLRQSSDAAYQHGRAETSEH